MGIFRPAESDVDRYRELRAESKALISKLFETAKGPKFDILKAARKLTIPVQERTVIFDSETDTNALAEFFLNEMRFGGKRIVDVLAESDADLTPRQRALVESRRTTSASLYAILSADPVACQVKVRDLLQSGRPEIAFTDINLSRSAASSPGDLLFMRVLHADGIWMSSGMFFGFSKVHRVYLLNAYQARMATVDEKERVQRTYIFFYQKYRELGIPQDYRDV